MTPALFAAYALALLGLGLSAYGACLARRRPPPRLAFRLLAWGPPIATAGIAAVVILELQQQPLP